MDRSCFFGVGLGAGSIGNVTHRARELLKAADKIFCPRSRSSERSLAHERLDAIDQHNAETVEYPLSMRADDKTLSDDYDNVACSIRDSIRDDNLTLAVTVGDPFLYSTLGPLMESLESYLESDKIESVIGVNSVQAAASRLNRPLAQGTEKFCVVPLTGPSVPAESLFAAFDTLAFTKVNRGYSELFSQLESLDLLSTSFLFERLGTTEENVRRLDELSVDRAPPYFSLVLCFRERTLA